MCVENVCRDVCVRCEAVYIVCVYIVCMGEGTFGGKVVMHHLSMNRVTTTTLPWRTLNHYPPLPTTHHHNPPPHAHTHTCTCRVHTTPLQTKYPNPNRCFNTQLIRIQGAWEVSLSVSKFKLTVQGGSCYVKLVSDPGPNNELMHMSKHLIGQSRFFIYPDNGTLHPNIGVYISF